MKHCIPNLRGEILFQNCLIKWPILLKIEHDLGNYFLYTLQEVAASLENYEVYVLTIFFFFFFTLFLNIQSQVISIKIVIVWHNGMAGLVKEATH